MSEPNLSEQIREYVTRISQSGPDALAGLYDLLHKDCYVLLLRSLVISTTRRMRYKLRWLRRLLARQPWRLRASHGINLLRMVRNESLMILRKKKRWTIGSILDFGLK